MKTHPNLAMLLVRVPLGAYLAIAGWSKISGGIGNFVSTSAGTIPSYLPHLAGKAYLYAVPVAELIIGSFLVAGFVTRFSGLVAALMIISFTMAVTGLKANGGPFHANVILIGIGLAVALAGPGKYSVDAILPKRKTKGKE